MSASDIAAPPADLDASANLEIPPTGSEPAAAGVAPELLPPSELEAELAKWRARVPKLAKALKERTDRVSLLEERLAYSAGSVKDAEAAVTVGQAARQKLIEELEQRQQVLKERCHGAEAKLHAQGAALEEAEADVRQWRAKWQELTVALDEQSARASSAEAQVRERQQALDEAQAGAAQLADEHDQLQSDQANLQATLDHRQEELERLRTRNEQLNETTEFANRQIESLSGSCEQQSLEIRALRRERVELQETLESNREERAGLAAQVEALQEERTGLSEALDVQREQAAAIERSLRDEVSKQQELLNRLTQRLEESTARLNRERAESSIQALEAVALVQLQDATSIELDANRLELEHSEHRVAELSAANSAADELQAATAAALEAERTQSTELEAAIEALAGARDAAEAECAALQQSRDELTAERDALLEAASAVDPQLEAQLEVHLEARVEAEQAVVLLQSECLRIERQRAVEQDELNAARDHNDQVAQALVCAQQAHAELEAQRSQLAERVRTLEADVQYAASDRALLEQERQQRDVAAALVFSLEAQLASTAVGAAAAGFDDAANDPEYPGAAMGALHNEAAADSAAGSATTDDETTADDSGAVSTPEATLARLGSNDVDKLVLVLNQQLADARAENERLQARLRTHGQQEAKKK